MLTELASPVFNSLNILVAIWLIDLILCFSVDSKSNVTGLENVLDYVFSSIFVFVNYL